MPDGGIGEAMLLSSIIGGGAAVTGAALSSHAAGTAADAQVKSANDALAFHKQQYETAQRNLSPYMNLGPTALPHLTSLAGMHSDHYGLPGNVAAPRMSLASVAGPSMGASYGSSPNAAANPDGMVRMQAPTGEIQMVPAGKRAMYEARGARMV